MAGADNGLAQLPAGHAVRGAAQGNIFIRKAYNMTSEESGKIGELTGAVDTLRGNYETMRRENREDFDKIFRSLNAIAADGCARGHRNEQRIESLEKRPERTVSTLAAIASMIAGALAVMAFWRA